MAVRSGLAGQFGIVDEVTWGTRVVVTRFLEMAEEDFSTEIERVESFDVRASSGTSAGTVQRSDRWAAGTKTSTGKVSFKGIPNKGFSLILKHIHGVAPTITTPGGGTSSRLHTYADVGDPYGLSTTIQIGTPDVGGTVDVREYTGCKVTAASFSQEMNDWATAEVEWDGQAETVNQSLAAASYVASQTMYSWKDLAVTIAGGAVNCLGFKLDVAVPLKTDRFYSGTQTKAEQLLNGEREITGSVDLEFGGLTEYNRYIAGTQSALTATWTGAVIEGALSYFLKFNMANVRWEKPDGPNLKGPDILTITCPFKVLYNGTDAALITTYQSTDTAV